METTVTYAKGGEDMGSNTRVSSMDVHEVSMAQLKAGVTDQVVPLIKLFLSTSTRNRFDDVCDIQSLRVDMLTRRGHSRRVPRPIHQQRDAAVPVLNTGRRPRQHSGAHPCCLSRLLLGRWPPQRGLVETRRLLKQGSRLQSQLSAVPPMERQPPDLTDVDNVLIATVYPKTRHSAYFTTERVGSLLEPDEFHGTPERYGLPPLALVKRSQIGAYPTPHMGGGSQSAIPVIPVCLSGKDQCMFGAVATSGASGVETRPKH
ncbi:hypothetical protein Bbelb_114000 [Branchiostoma belcheri]|nr:hypothetical protein Bbelb_114000 [Branchiostoma belcheri]